MGEHLQAGRVRLLFVADRIPPELRRVVEFLNRQMQPAEVLAVELRQYEGEGLRTLVPLVLGQTQDAVEKKARTGGGGDKWLWDEASVMAEIEHRATPAAVTAAGEVLSWIRRSSDRVTFNTNPTWGWVGAEFEAGGVRVPLLRLHSDGSVAVYFENMIGKPVFGDVSRRQQLLDRLNAVPGINLPADAVNKRKTIPLASFTPESTAAFLGAMDWCVAELCHGQTHKAE